MELSFSGSVPIYSYRRPRSNSASSKKTPFFKTKKKNNAIKVSTTRKDGNRSSTSSDAPATVTVNNNVGSRPSTSDHENQAAAAAAARQGQGPSPTGSSASLPPPDEPPPPLSARFVRDSPSLATSTRHPPGQPPLRSASNSNEAVNSANLPLSDLAARSAHAKTARPIEGAVAMGAANELSKVHSHSTQKSIDVSETIVNFGMGPQSGGNTFAVPPGPNQFNPVATYHHVQDMAAKRVSTLDYLRKTHEGRVYWFNTLLFSRADISRLPSFDLRKLARRATNFLLLGLSLPTILDLNTTSPTDYLRALNALLLEFEAYQQIHPSDGTGASSLSRARIPQMFKRSYGTNSRGRRVSSAAEIGLPMSNSDADLKAMNGTTNTTAPATTNFSASEQELLPGEEYTHLLTPSLPFDPDFFEVFATLCDVLIDCYMRITQLISSPSQCAPGVAELFAKADAKLRKVIVAGIIKEFEDAARAGVKAEVAGIGKVVLGGLI